MIKYQELIGYIFIIISFLVFIIVCLRILYFEYKEYKERKLLNKIMVCLHCTKQLKFNEYLYCKDCLNKWLVN